MRRQTRQYWQVALSVLLFFDGLHVQAQNWTHRGPRPANLPRSSRHLSFTETQNDALQSEVMCQFVGELNSAHETSVKLDNRRSSLEKLEAKIKAEQELMEKNRELEKSLESQYNAGVNTCQQKIKNMWGSCNSCITDKCADHWKSHCDSREEPEIIPPCRNSPNHRTCGGNTPEPDERVETVPKPNGNKPNPGGMIITVNGEVVPDVNTAISKIKATMSQITTPPCEPGSKFSQFNSVVSDSRPSRPSSNQPSSQQIQSSFSTSSRPNPGSSSNIRQTSVSYSGNLGNMGDFKDMDIGEMLLQQASKVGENQKVNITIGVNGKQKHFDSFDELFANKEMMNSLNSFNKNFDEIRQNLPQRNSPVQSRPSYNRPAPVQSRPVPSRQPSSSRYSQIGRQSSSRQNSPNSITHTSRIFKITSSGSPGQSQSNSRQASIGQSSRPVQSGCSSCNNGGCSMARSAAPSNTGCKTYSSTSIGGSGQSRDLFADLQSQLTQMIQNSGSSPNSQIRFSHTSSNGNPANGLAQEIVNNGKFSDDGKTFSYSWTSNGEQTPDVDLSEVMGLLGQRMQRQSAARPGPSRCRSSRCTRNIKYGLSRRKRYSPAKTRRAVSQCAIEQAAQEAAERQEREKAERMAALAAQGGFDSACSMLSSQFGENQMNQMVKQMVQNVVGQIQRAQEACQKNGNCGNTRVDIDISGKSIADCGSQPNSPCSKNPETQSPQNKQPAQKTPQSGPEPERNNPPSSQSLNSISARLQKWSQTWSGSWSSSSTGNNNRQSSTSLNIQGGSDSRNPSSSKIQIDISGGSNPPKDTECSRHAAQHDLNDLVPGEVNRPSGCSQCTRCNAEEPEIPGVEPTERTPSRGSFDEEPELTTAAPKRTANPEPSFPDDESIVELPKPNPSQNPSRNDYEDPNPAPEVSEAPETDYSYENPGVPDPYNSYDSNPSESNTYDDGTNEYVPPNESEDYPQITEASWSAFWGEWSSCDIQCSQGGEPGSQSRKRECLYEDQTPAPVGTGMCTFGQDTTFRECDPTPPPCSKWASWGFWSQCSATCGSGRRTRQRSCLYGGSCPGANIEEENCINSQRPECPSWSNWQIGTLCSVTCGTGMTSQFRTCKNGQIGEDGCSGPAAKHDQCHTGKACPYWDLWSDWSDCSVTCGRGTVSRSRECVNGNPGDHGCEGNDSEQKVCRSEKQFCPTWSAWGEFTQCSATCGEGEQIRVRECHNGSPGDAGCEGITEEVIPCTSHREQCPEWDFWARWSTCSVTCGEGSQLRTRQCLDGVPGELGCVGSPAEERNCYGARRECEYWGQWESWYPCSVTCGTGITTRSRPCINGSPGDLGCPGRPQEQDECVMQDCEIFVEYDGDDELIPDAKSICPEILTASKAEPEAEELEDDEFPETDPEDIDYRSEVIDVPPRRNYSCEEIFRQESEACVNMFSDQCASCDTELESVCPETTQLKKQLDQVRADMKTSLEKIEFYASKKRERQSDMINLAKNMAENHSWVQSVFQQSIQGAKSQQNYLAPCEINKVSVMPEPYRSGSVIAISAQLTFPPFASISIDVEVEGDCCSNANSMARTRREIGAVVLDHIRKITQRS